MAQFFKGKAKAYANVGLCRSQCCIPSVKKVNRVWHTDEMKTRNRPFVLRLIYTLLWGKKTNKEIETQ